LAYSPLGRGLLTGKVGPERKFPPGDLRLADPRFMQRNREKTAGMLDKFRPVADAHRLTLAQLAIAWTLHQPGVTHALCGARNPEQARENAAAGDVTLSDEELATIDGAIAEHSKK
jgi:aryl-alcohol dehydrogenase-like predicted oxidoreductase